MVFEAFLDEQHLLGWERGVVEFQDAAHKNLSLGNSHAGQFGEKFIQAHDGMLAVGRGAASW